MSGYFSCSVQPEETASAVFCWGFYIHAAFVKES